PPPVPSMGSGTSASTRSPGKDASGRSPPTPPATRAPPPTSPAESSPQQTSLQVQTYDRTAATCAGPDYTLCSPPLAAMRACAGTRLLLRLGPIERFLGRTTHFSGPSLYMYLPAAHGRTLVDTPA